MHLTWTEGRVSADRHGPEDAAVVVLLSHGAGKDKDDPLLVAMGERLGASGIGVVRFNLPYREAGRKAPGSPASAEACWRDVIAWARAEHGAVYAGGKSYGGRMASNVVAQDAPCDGMVFLGYPLHPPGKPERVRDAHLPDIACPMLFVQGSRDPFATPELRDATVAKLDRASLHLVEDGDHSLKVRGRPEAEVWDEVAARIAAFVAG